MFTFYLYLTCYDGLVSDTTRESATFYGFATGEAMGKLL